MTRVPMLAWFLVACGTPDDEPAVACARVFYADADGDAHGNENDPITACTAPLGYAANDDDCDDADPAVHPGAAETCDGLDQDCDGGVDEDAIDAPAWYGDADGDGFGDGASRTIGCAQPTGSVATSDDCDDADAAVSPGADEKCNDVDDDCDALVDSLDPGLVDGSTWYDDDDADGYGDDDTPWYGCEQPAGTVSIAGDCNDLVAEIEPDALEVCDGIDNDCDGLTDDDDALDEAWTFHADADGDGYGDSASALDACIQPVGYVYDARDCDDTSADVGTARPYFSDGDGDGYGTGTATAATCTPPAGVAPVWGDCDDTEAAVSPGATEVCNGIDDNCDDRVDLDDPLLVMDAWYDDDDGDGFGDDTNIVLSCDPVDGYIAIGGDCDDDDAAVNAAATEYCDGVDNDCTGVVDDDVEYFDWYRDDDGDGYGSDDATVFDCVAPAGRVLVPGDCDDSSAAISPAATESCATVDDDDCDGAVSDCEYALADDAALSLQGADQHARIGSFVDVADFDADGTADLVVGCPECGRNWGEAFLVFGPASGILSVEDTVALTAAGTGPGAPGFGADVSGGDADGDGFDDVIVGAGALSAVVYNAAYLFRGPVIGSRDRADADADLAPWDALERVESRVVPDVDGDGVADIVVGSPNGAYYNQGRAYVVTGAVSGVVDLETDATYEYTSPAGSTWDGLGADIADLGDTNGDGLEDFALSAPSADVGIVYVVEGGASAGSYTIDAAAAAAIAGDDGAAFGEALASADVDGDGTTDLLVGAPYTATGVATPGAVYLYLGPFSGSVAAADAIATWSSSFDDAEVGRALAAGGDVDGDKQPDLLIGASSGSFVGAAYLQLGPASGAIDIETLPRFVGVGAADYAGSSVAFVPDWDGDGNAEIAVGSIGFQSDDGHGIGKVDVMLSGDL